MGRIVQLALALQLVGVCSAGQPIGILFDFATQPEPAVVDLMKSEIRAILAPAELDLSFHRVSDSAASQPFRKIIIVRFLGSCQILRDSGYAQWHNAGLLEYPALGRTDISAGHILPYVQIYCNEVRAFVPSVSTTPFAQLYGRALGRVVAHELYHALLSTRDHTREGVARFAQTARDLTGDKLPLDALSIGRLREMYGPSKKEGGSGEPPSNAVSQSINEP